MNENQKQMISLHFFLIYGLFNRLVKPWKSIEI